MDEFIAYCESQGDAWHDEAAMIARRFADTEGIRRHLDFCAGGEFCSVDDCLCECHIREWHKVEVSPDDIAALRAALDTPDPGAS